MEAEAACIPRRDEYCPGDYSPRATPGASRLYPSQDAAPPRDGESSLLRKAVMSLERKLQEKAQALAAAEAERDTLRQHRERWQAGEAELVRVIEEATRLRREAETKDCELAQLRPQAAEVAVLQRQLAERDARLEQWKADREAAAVGCARALSQQAVAAAALVQLEAANEALRLDCKEHAAKLRQAYEREAELLNGIGKLKEEQRSRAGPAGEEQEMQQPKSGRGKGGGGGGGPTKELDALHRDLFLAAAQHMLKEFLAKVEQAERKASTLGAQLQAAETRFGGLAARCRSLEAQLASTSGQCAQNEAAVQAVLASNMRLHEWVAQLMNQAAAGAAAAAQQAKAGNRGKTYQRPTQASMGKQGGAAAALAYPPDCSGCCGQCGASRGGAASRQSLAQRQQPVATGEAPAAVAAADGTTPSTARSIVSSRQGMPLGAAAAELGPLGSSRQHNAAAQQQAEAARGAAVEAALAISTEYKELHEYYKAVVAEVRRVGSCLSVACSQESRQQLVAQQQELEKELWDVAEQLELKVGQLTALKHAGLL